MTRYLTLTLNPCIDRTYLPDGTYTEEAGGKGINAARVLSALGDACTALAPVGTGENGERFRRLCSDDSIELLAVPVSGDTRRIDTVRRADGTDEQKYVRGRDMTNEEVAAMKSALSGVLDKCDVLLICGSAPGPVSASFAYDAVIAAKKCGIPVLLDSHGEALARGLDAGPDVIKPNENELKQLAGGDIPEYGEENAALGVLHAYFEKGLRGVIVSLGERGAVWVSENGSIFCPAPRVECVNPVGSGDCFTAVLCHCLINGFNEHGALAAACSAGAANARVFPAARITRADIEELLGRPLP